MNVENDTIVFILGWKKSIVRGELKGGIKGERVHRASLARALIHSSIVDLPPACIDRCCPFPFFLFPCFPWFRGVWHIPIKSFIKTLPERSNLLT